MFSMQYGFDVTQAEAVRQRIAEIGSRFDQLPGLYIKAFLVADAVDAVPARYTPFYIWNELSGMTDFLLSDAFRAVVAKYGRPIVQRWNQVAFIEGPDITQKPTFAVQQFIDIEDADIANFCALHIEHANSMKNMAGLHSLFLGLDTRSWQLMKISLWDRPGMAEGKEFDVEHLSAPGIAK